MTRHPKPTRVYVSKRKMQTANVNRSVLLSRKLDTGEGFTIAQYAEAAHCTESNASTTLSGLVDLLYLDHDSAGDGTRRLLYHVTKKADARIEIRGLA